MTPAFRRSVLGLHRWVALALALPAVAVTLAGTVLVFRAEIAGDIVAPAWPADAWERAAQAARQAGPAGSSLEIVPRGDRAEVLVDGKQGRTIEVDPASGRVMSDERSGAPGFAFVFRLHTRLAAGAWAEWIVALAGTVLLVSAATGLALAWPVSSRAWRYVLRVRVGGGWQPFATDLHRVLGIAASPLLALNAVTGLVLVFSTPAAQLVTALAPRAAPAASALPAAPCAPCTLDQLVAHAESLVPGARAIRVVVEAPGDPVGVRLRRPAEEATQGMNRVFLDAATGRVVRAVPLERAAAGAAMFEWLYPVHTGRWMGFAWRVALAAAGIAPLVALATGFALWFVRRRARQKRGLA